MWRTSSGHTGPGRAMPLAQDTGAFWFFNPDSLELLVKVLDGCTVNGRYWVFATGLTNVEVALTVRDTQAGAAWTYFHPLGTAFPPVLDIEALASCP